MSSMTKQAQQRVGVLQGTLDMLILRTLLYGPAHGHQIGKHIQATTNDFLQMQHGSLYPALHRLEKQSLLDATWGTSDNNRKARYYKLTSEGRKRLRDEEKSWNRLAAAMTLALNSRPGES